MVDTAVERLCRLCQLGHDHGHDRGRPQVVTCETASVTLTQSQHQPGSAAAAQGRAQENDVHGPGQLFLGTAGQCLPCPCSCEGHRQLSAPPERIDRVQGAPPQKHHTHTHLRPPPSRPHLQSVFAAHIHSAPPPPPQVRYTDTTMQDAWTSAGNVEQRFISKYIQKRQARSHCRYSFHAAPWCEHVHVNHALGSPAVTASVSPIRHAKPSQAAQMPSATCRSMPAAAIAIGETVVLLTSPLHPYRNTCQT